MKSTPLVWLAATTLPCLGTVALAQAAQEPPPVALETVTVEASADASAEGLSPAYAGGQVARGGRVGILGTKDNMSTPFSVTSYTNDLIRDRQARSVGEVLQNDPGIRVARGFGNFQESYFMRGFVLGSDDVAYNGLYGLLPRQYIATELFERVEVLRGASAFLTGATPSGGGIGGVINLVPKRAPSEPLTRLTGGFSSDSGVSAAADIARRFGPDDSMGIRINAANRSGESGVDGESNKLTVGSIGLDWRGEKARLSGDIGWQDNRLRRTRPNVTLGAGVTTVPTAPDASENFAQPWSYSNERDTFGSLRGEYDFNEKITGWAAYGMRRSKEANSLANVTVTNGSTGASTIYRFDNTREDRVNTGEIGVRAKTRTGPIGHEFVVSASHFELEKKNAYAMDFRNTRATNIYDPISYSRPAFSANTLYGNDLDDPALNGRTRLTSYAIGDTLSALDERVLLTLGMRHQRLYDRSFAYNTGVGQTPYEKSRNTPAAGLVFKLNSQVSLYGNYIEALTRGDSAPSTAINLGESLAPYVSKQKEIGVKYDGGGIGAGLALFTTSKPRGVLGTDRVFRESGKDRHQGAELTVFGEATRSIRVLGGVTWLDAEQRDTGSATTDGKRVIGVPRFQATLGAEWDIPGISGLSVDGRVVYTGASYANATNTLRVPSWTRLDAGLRYNMDVSGHLVTLRARVDNVLNRDYWASVGGYPGSGYLALGAPRTYSLTASFEF